MTIKVLVFDLDDTLYDELEYVRSGLKHVAEVLSERFRWDVEDTDRQLQASLAVSRSKIFDRVLAQKGVFTPELIDQCVALYRKHWPSIRIPNRTKRLLKKLAKQYPLYVVTDGHAFVQQRKLDVLGLLDTDLIKKCFVTYEFGQDYVKPSPKCFEEIASLEGCSTEEVVYIADNIDKDFVGIKPLGFKTIRLNQGQHKDKKPKPEQEAEHVADDIFAAIDLLTEL